MTNKIIFNGKEYNSVEEMPPDARRAYEEAMGQFGNMFADADKDGLPDIFENLSTGNRQNAHGQNARVFSTSKIFFTGQAYDSVDDMPLEARQKYEQAFQDKDRDGVPDVFENMGQMNVFQATENVPASTMTNAPGLSHAHFPKPASPVHSPVGLPSKVWLVAAGVVIVFLLIIVAGLLFILLT